MEVIRTSSMTFTWKVEASGSSTYLQVTVWLNGLGIVEQQVVSEIVQARSLSRSGTAHVREGRPPNPLMTFEARVGDYPQPGWGPVKARLKRELKPNETSARLNATD